MRFVRKNKKRARSRVIVTFSLYAVSAIYWQDLEKSQERLQRRIRRWSLLTCQTWKQSHISLSRCTPWMCEVVNPLCIIILEFDDFLQSSIIIASDYSNVLLFTLYSQLRTMTLRSYHCFTIGVMDAFNIEGGSRFRKLWVHKN